MSKKGRKASSKLGGVATAVIGVLVVTLFVLHRVGVVDLDLLGEDTTSPSSGEASTELSGDRAQEQLSELRVEEEDDQPGYDRALFPHWNDNVEDNCTTRQVVLLRDGEDVEVGDDCQPDSGSWHSPYEGETFTDPQDIDIDHMVALKESWRSGAHAWTTEERQDFANDLETSQLWAVSASTNRAKGDADPADWLPPLESVHCDYVVSWIEVKHTWDLTVDPEEEEALREVLFNC